MQYLSRRLVYALFYILLVHTSSASAAFMTQAVSFVSQAPSGNWAQPWQDFCEEASAVMTAHFLWQRPLTSSIAAQEIQIIKRYEEIVFGRYRDTSIEETAQILRELYGFSVAGTP
ncbi:MAG: Uncharacterized protein G01um101466_475 [Parcubacteria group bacterium Gr01-1014_66]|nr:MAG: Uncharacterized protein G01um101466_475 [Parcubacteria group bacterium Gr01-1014_66]